MHTGSEVRPRKHRVFCLDSVCCDEQTSDMTGLTNHPGKSNPGQNHFMIPGRCLLCVLRVNRYRPQCCVPSSRCALTAGCRTVAAAAWISVCSVAACFVPYAAGFSRPRVSGNQPPSRFALPASLFSPRSLRLPSHKPHYETESARRYAHLPPTPTAPWPWRERERERER